MKVGVVVFPGSNCDHDAFYAASLAAGAKPYNIWHKDTELPKNLDLIILPGGFSYGDYLRCGSIASFSPIMREVKEFANRGGYVMGICNGFQILTESGLLPGALLRNQDLSFVCKDVYLKTLNKDSAFTSQIPDDKVLRIPVAHGEGNYFADEDTIKELKDNGQIAFQYCSPEGVAGAEYNPNGSMNDIAGILNKNKNVLGMMPHPERYSDITLGCDDGLYIFKSLKNNFLALNI